MENSGINLNDEFDTNPVCESVSGQKEAPDTAAIRHIALQFAADIASKDVPRGVDNLIQDAKHIEAYLKNG